MEKSLEHFYSRGTDLSALTFSIFANLLLLVAIVGPTYLLTSQAHAQTETSRAATAKAPPIKAKLAMSPITAASSTRFLLLTCTP